VSQKRVTTVLVWTVAIVLPGGLALLALWLSLRAAQARQQNGTQPRNPAGATADSAADATTNRAFSWAALARRVGAR
jgi:flagellar basal body-associated protein FliL